MERVVESCEQVFVGNDIAGELPLPQLLARIVEEFRAQSGAEFAREFEDLFAAIEDATLRFGLADARVFVHRTSRELFDTLKLLQAPALIGETMLEMPEQQAHVGRVLVIAFRPSRIGEELLDGRLLLRPIRAESGEAGSDIRRDLAMRAELFRPNDKSRILRQL